VFDLYLITPDLPAAEVIARARDALSSARPGRVALQLRAPQLAPGALRALGEALRALSSDAGAPLLVNADLSLAGELGAAGVQLPERGPSVVDARAALPRGALIGASRHDLEGVRSAAAAGATFVTLSPVFAVPGKNPPLGIERFGAIARAATVPVFALGGVGERHAVELVRAGAHGVAAIREVFDGSDPASAVLRLLRAIEEGRAAPPLP
jgi:thiamine-phosphate pyrophosphorylase